MLKSLPSESLSKKVVRGGLWVFSLRAINRGLRFIRIIILARLLAPTDFGLFGIAMLALSTLETFSQAGFKEALVQKKENVQSYLDTAWTVLVGRGLVLFLILFFSASLVARFFNSAESLLVIRIIAISTLLSGFENIGIILFQKELEFNRQFFYELSGTLVNLIVAIVLAIILRNVWALIWSSLAGSLMRCVMSYVLHPYRPRLKFNTKQFQILFRFGKWVLASTILVFLISQGDDIFVGKLLGVTALGLYQLAYAISNLPATEITHIISRVSFPAYSKLQDDYFRLKNAYLKVLQLNAVVSFPLAGAIFVLAQDFTQIFLGEKWLSMVPAMQALVLWGLIRSVGATTGPIFYSVGKPNLATKLQFIQLILLTAFIYPLTARLGILGTSLSVVLAAVIPNLLAFYFTIKITQCGLYNFSKQIGTPLMGSMISVLSVVFLKAYEFVNWSLLAFIINIAFFLIIYSASISVFGRLFDYRIWHLIKYIGKESIE
jgi:O-antigen/teichoic acid export membrane protein